MSNLLADKHVINAKTQLSMSNYLFDDQKYIFIDFFAGGGGASTGIKQAIGRDPDIAINHDEVALSMHAANHLQTVHLDVDVFEHHPKNVTKGKKIIGWFSPDCFPGDTLVLTKKGYMPISEIAVGEYVLTHNQRWRKVNKIFKSSKIVNTIRGQGHHGIKVSSEHPFYIREYRKFWNNDVRQYRHDFSEPQWTKAGKLEAKKHFWGTPTMVPALPIPSVGGRGMEIDEKLLWLAGRYVGDGWSRLYRREAQNRAEIVIICAKKEKDELLKRLNQWERNGSRSQFNEIAWTIREMQSTYQFSTSHKGLVEWLRKNFGHKAEHKTIPAWLYGAKTDYVEAFLDGYFSADGHKRKVANKDKHFVTTTSKKLAYGLKTILATLGRFANVYFTIRKPTTIEGRAINAKPVFNLEWRNSFEEDHQYAKKIDGIFWSRIKHLTIGTEKETVYNLSVEEDESYVVEGIIVHNCTWHCNAKGTVLDRHGEHDKSLKYAKKGTRCAAQDTNKATRVRGLAWVALGYALCTDLELFFLENVKEFLDWSPVFLNSKGEYVADKTKKGQTFKAFIQCLTTGLPRDSATLPEIREFLSTFLIDDYDEEKLFKGLGYEVQWQLLKACDYGAPTIRERLFMIARKDGRPIVWPKATHANPHKLKSGQKPWVGVHEVIDFSLPSYSIFMSKAEKDAKKLRIKRPLQDSTLRRIGKGLEKFVINEPEPFLVTVNHKENKEGEFRGQSTKEPLHTITTKLGTGIVVPNIKKIDTQDSTILAPCISTYFGERKDENGDNIVDGRGHRINQPVSVITAGGMRHALVLPELVQLPYIVRDFNKSIGSHVSNPVGVITTGGNGKCTLSTAHAVKFRGSNYGYSVKEPSHTITAEGTHQGIIETLLSDGKEIQNSHLSDGYAQTYLHACFGTHSSFDSYRKSVEYDDVTGVFWDKATKARIDAVRTFLSDFTSTSDESALGIITINGAKYQIIDITLRMLTPRELFSAQGFPENYIIDRTLSGRMLTKEEQVRMVGNSVSPKVAEAIVKANVFSYSDIPFVEAA